MGTTRTNNVLTGRELAAVLPKIYAMHSSGISPAEIAKATGFRDDTIRGWVYNYEKWQNGEEYCNITRAVPFLQHKSPSLFTANEATKPCDKANNYDQSKIKSQFFEALPDKFRTEQARQIAETFGIAKRTATHWLATSDEIVRVQRSSYMKKSAKRLKSDTPATHYNASKKKRISIFWGMLTVEY